MKYQCISNMYEFSGEESDITIGKIYQSIKSKYTVSGCIFIKNDKNKMYNYPTYLFKPLRDINIEKLHELGI